jgi:hypothetical protein
MKILLILAIAAALAEGQGTSRFQTFEQKGGQIRTVQSKLTDTISVKDFGATGNGVTDDTVAIQTGLNAACGGTLAITATTGAAVSPIVVTTAAHALVNGVIVTISGVAGNTAANGTWSTVSLTTTTLALYSVATGAASTGNGAWISGGTLIAPSTPRLYFPAGTYNISTRLKTGCAMFLSGDGPTASMIVQTRIANLNGGILSNFSIWIQDLAINTAPLVTQQFMIAVEVGDSVAAAPMLGYTVTFLRFNSSGFNFGMDVNGTSETDLLASITVRDCNIAVSAPAGAVAEPINAANAVFLTVEDSTLSGNSNTPPGTVMNDHGIYTLAIRGVLIQNNLIQNNGDSAVKLLQGGFASASCPTIQDYTSWTVTNNRLLNNKFPMVAYSYCALILPAVTFTNNLVLNSWDTYLGNTAAFTVQANCQSVISKVTLAGNTFQNIGLGAIYMQSQTQGVPCANLTAVGTISNFSSTGDTIINFSQSSPGTFPAINSSGPTTAQLRASVAQLRVDGGGTGNAALNLLGFLFASVVDTVEVNTTAPLSASPNMVLMQPAAGVAVHRTIMAASPTANAWEIKDYLGNTIAAVDPAMNLLFPNSPGIYFSNGVKAGPAGAHMVIGHYGLTLGTVTVNFTGAAVFTSSTSYDCTGSNNTSALAFNIALVSGSQVIITGTGTNTISMICAGS